MKHCPLTPEDYAIIRKRMPLSQTVQLYRHAQAADEGTCANAADKGGVRDGFPFTMASIGMPTREAAAFIEAGIRCKL